MVFKPKERGDTLIEVLFAVAVFSAVAIGSMVIMNQGINTAQKSLEINLVRNQIDTQTALLRQMNDAKLSSLGRSGSFFAHRWDDTIDLLQNKAKDYGYIDSFDKCDPSELPPNAFFIDPNTGAIVHGQSHFKQPATFAQIRLSDNSSIPSTSEMIWIQVINSSKSREDSTNHILNDTVSYDFHIRACWQPPGRAEIEKIGTIVRLYAPAK